MIKHYSIHKETVLERQFQLQLRVQPVIKKLNFEEDWYDYIKYVGSTIYYKNEVLARNSYFKLYGYENGLVFKFELTENDKKLILNEFMQDLKKGLE